LNYNARHVFYPCAGCLFGFKSKWHPSLFVRVLSEEKGKETN
jgi:hypothetical protein